jgi:hypothetical protein
MLQRGRLHVCMTFYPLYQLNVHERGYADFKCNNPSPSVLVYSVLPPSPLTSLVHAQPCPAQ